MIVLETRVHRGRSALLNCGLTTLWRACCLQGDVWQEGAELPLSQCCAHEVLGPAGMGKPWPLSSVGCKGHMGVARLGFWVLGVLAKHSWSVKEQQKHWLRLHGSWPLLLCRARIWDTRENAARPVHPPARGALSHHMASQDPNREAGG